VSFVFSYDGKPVLLSELRGESYFLKKLVGNETNITWLKVRNGGIWPSGSPASRHIFFFPHEPARLAGNTLVWQENETTYRLERPGSN